MACTVAVESVISDHYQEQLDTLAENKDEKDLMSHIKKFKEEEEEHHDIGSDGEVLRGGRYIQESYVIGNVSVGMTYESWKVEAFVDNVFDKSAILNIDTQQYTPKVVTNRPRTVGVRFSYDYY